MTEGIGSAATRKVMQRLSGPSGDSQTVAALTDGDSAGPAMRALNAATELVERSAAVKYPLVSVHCEKIINNFREKFRSFSGTVEMAIEVRHSQDRLEGMQAALEEQTDAVTRALTASRGDWGDGMFYAGGYEVSFGRAARGGKNFTQATKITFEIGVSRS